jgi:uncharacterized protein with NRDE domain
LPAGIYGLSNATLDTPWDKVVRSKAALSNLLERGHTNETHLLQILNDRRKGPVNEVLTEGFSFSKAHALSAPFITLPDYGTRCSTVVLAKNSGEFSFLERRFDADGVVSGESRFSFDASRS